MSIRTDPFLVIVGFLFLVVSLLVVSAAMKPINPVCHGIAHVVRRDTVYYEVACPRGAPVTFDTSHLHTAK